MKDKSLQEPGVPGLVQFVSEEIEDLLSDSENDTFPDLDAYSSRGKLTKSRNKIVKLCSPVLRVEPGEKRGSLPKKLISH